MSQANPKTQIRYRLATEEDRPAIENALVYAYEVARSTKDWVSSYSLEDKSTIASHILESDAIVIEDSYLFVYDIVDVWHSPRRALNELLCLRIYKTKATFEVVIQAMEEIARDNNCFLITVATALHHTNDELASRYKSFGFKPEEVRLYKTLKE